MYIHLGNDFIVRKENIVGIFDLDNTTVSKRTREFLKRAEKNGEVVNINFELPKSFILCSENKTNTVYISQLSSSTLYKRNSDELESIEE